MMNPFQIRLPQIPRIPNRMPLGRPQSYGKGGRPMLPVLSRRFHLGPMRRPMMGQVRPMNPFMGFRPY